VKRALALVAMGLVLAACGIGAQQSPQSIARHSVPFGLMAPASTTTTVLVPTSNVAIYLKGRQRLVAVDRAVSDPVTVRSALSALAQGATNSESAQGLESPVSLATPLSLKSIKGTTAVVDLPSSFANLGGQDQIIAVAQIVYTLSLFPRIRQVSIRVGGSPAQVPTGTGRLSPGPLTRKDYASLAPL